MIRLFLVALLAAAPSVAWGQQATYDTSLDFLVGDWALFDANGKQVGTSTIVAEFPGSMLLETRKVDGQPPQPLWFENAEAEGGWSQLFVGPQGKVRMFKPVSPQSKWPLELGSDVTLQDGTPVRFKMTMTHPSAERSNRKLEMSRDAGATWTTVFDYEYRRKAGR